MAQKAQEATKENIDKTMATLGYDKFQVPGGAEVAEVPTEAPVSVPTEVEPEEKMQEIEEVEPENEIPAKQEVSDEELKRRSFQAEAEREKARARQLEEQNRMLMQQILLSSQPKQQTPAQKKEPELYDFIGKDEYDPREALDPSTASGQAYLKFQRAVTRFDSENQFETLTRQQQERQSQEAAYNQAKAIAKEFPEFRQPFSDEPDLNKINMALGDLAKPENWINLLKLTKTPPAPQNTNVIDKVGKRADKAASAATAVSSSEGKKKLPESVEQLQKMYGNFQLPSNFTE